MPMSAPGRGQQPLVPLKLRLRGDTSPKHSIVQLLEERLRIGLPPVKFKLQEGLLGHARSLTGELAGGRARRV